MTSAERLKPIRIPIGHKAGDIVYQRLIANSEIKLMTKLCYSAQMFCMDLGDVPDERLADFPSNESMKDYVAIAVHRPHYYNGRWISDDETMQLDRDDAQAFRSILAEEFWQDHDEFWHDKMELHRKTRPDRQFSYYDCLLDFMEFWRISLNEEEALYRAAKRRKFAMKQNITSTVLGGLS